MNGACRQGLRCRPLARLSAAPEHLTRHSQQGKPKADPRLDHIPNTGRTDICSLIADVFFPQVFEAYEFEVEAQIIADCKGRRATTKAYASLGERFLEPDGN